jgi:serine protease Do
MSKSLLLAAAVSLAAALPVQAQAARDLRAVSTGMQGVVAKVLPAVVQVRTTAYGPLAGGSGTASLLGTQRSTGSGIILSADGYIVTNAHVVDGGRRFVVVLNRPAVAGTPERSALAPISQEASATLVGIDRETDLAVLKVELTGLPFATIGDSDSLAPGQVVLAFGSPFGLASSVTMGVISAVGRQLEDEGRMIYLQTDTPINPGNSGGPLVDIDGRVIGINTKILSQSGGSEGIGFAAPGNIVRFVYEQIKANRRVRRSEIGVFAQTITPSLAAALRLPREWGVILGDVYPNSPAQQAGLRIGDVIISLDGKSLENGRQFDVNMYRKRAGSTVVLEVARGVQRSTVRVPVVERREGADQFRDMVSPEKNLIPRLGILALDITPELAQMIPNLRSDQGVVVAAVGSDADGTAGLVAGDVIYGVNGAQVKTVGELRTAVDGLAAANAVVLQIGRVGQIRFLALTLD